jgi:hypothetical protein
VGAEQLAARPGPARRRRVGPEGPITDVIRKLGSARKVAVAADCSAESVYLAKQRGHFTAAAPALTLAKALFPDDPVQQLAAARRLAGLAPV